MEQLKTKIEINIERVSPKEERGRIKEDRTAIEAILYLRGNEVNYSKESK